MRLHAPPRAFAHAVAPVLRVAVLAVAMQARSMPGDWTCPECGASPVFASRSDCFRCGAPRPADGGRVAPRRRGGSEYVREEGDRAPVDVDRVERLIVR